MGGVVARAEGNAARHGRTAHAGHRLQRVEQRAIEQRRFAVERILLRRRSKLEGDQAVRVETERRALQVRQCLNEQAGANQQNCRKRDFGGGEAVAEPSAHATVQSASALLQHVVQIHLGRAPRRRDPKEQPCGDRQPDRKRQHRTIEMHTLHRKNIRRQCAVDRVHGPARTGETRHAADHRERHALREQLAQQPRAARTHRRAHGHFPLPRGRACQQQIRNIRASNQKHKADGAQKHEQSSLELRTDERVEKGDEVDAPVAHFGILLADPR